MAISPTGHDVRYLAVIDRETDTVEAVLKFFPSEWEMPGYVESVERGYEDTRWRTERRVAHVGITYR